MNTTTHETTGYIITAGDGKNVTVPDAHRMVKIGEKKEGRGKGKTVAFVLLPVLTPFSADDFAACEAMLAETLGEIQKDIVTRMQRDGMQAVSAEEVSVSACVAEWNNRTFSADTVGNWFDSEVSDLLAFRIATSKGWDASEIKEGSEEFKFLESKIAAYRASYSECAKKFPSLNPAQVQELIRVLDLLELTGAIPARIREKITPKVSSDVLGF